SENWKKEASAPLSLMHKRPVWRNQEVFDRCATDAAWGKTQMTCRKKNCQKDPVKWRLGRKI
ncbi:MAG: hypothetical protein J6P60_01325, partial [Lachnospiraceae bacterium]|nr:hypothetical protein [Lachnospiraceae bacterium]